MMLRPYSAKKIARSDCHIMLSFLLLLGTIISSLDAFSTNLLSLLHGQQWRGHVLFKNKPRPLWHLVARKPLNYRTVPKERSDDRKHYSLGLKPFRERNITAISNKEIKDLNSTSEAVTSQGNNTIWLDGGTNGVDGAVLLVQQDMTQNETLSSDNIPDTAEKSISSHHPALPDTKTAAVSKTEKSKNLFTETISQSFQFFDDKAKKASIKSNKNTDVSEIRSNSYRPFNNLDDLQSDHLLPPSTDTRNIGSTGNLDPSKPLTLADLQHILEKNGYVRREEVGNILSSPDGMQYNVTKKVTKSKSGVAFPQPTVLSNKHIKIGSMTSSGFFGLLLATTVRPNLWLLGGVVGSLVGGDLAEKAAEQPSSQVTIAPDGSLVPSPSHRIPGGLYGELTLKCGKKIASTYLKVWDLFQGIWFMYRTGQLSYEYYRTYAALDKRFGIQNKMDAWNARFIEGKENFDRWEKENEVGRKVLAGLRTVWMVEESSYKKQMYRKKGRRKSKYRLIQVVIDVTDWFKRLFHALWRAVRGGDNKEMNEIIKGIRIGFQELNLEVMSQRTGAAIAALVAVNFVGALFAVAPYLLGATAIVFGAIWPNWMGNTAKVIKEVIDETRARGRGEQITREQTQQRKEKLPFVDKKSFSFYIGKDGKKKWYRTGQSYRGNARSAIDKDNFSWRLPWLNNDDRMNTSR